MRKSVGLWTLFLTAGIVLGGAAVTAESRAAADVALSKARLIIEYNATAGDVGVQVFLDGEPWKTMKIFSPDGRRLAIEAGRNQTITAGSFKTAP